MGRRSSLQERMRAVQPAQLQSAVKALAEPTDDTRRHSLDATRRGSLVQHSREYREAYAGVFSLDKLCRMTVVACARSFCAALSAAGTLFTWGSGEHGCLGNHSFMDSPLPVIVRDLARLPIASVSVGAAHIACTSCDGRVFAWGSNDCGQLGVEGAAESHHPLVVPFAEDAPRGKHDVAAAVACGDHHTLVLTTSMLLWAFGNNSYGQLGIGDDRAGSYVLTPRHVTGVADVAVISAGALHSACVTSYVHLCCVLLSC